MTATPDRSGDPGAASAPTDPAARTSPAEALAAAGRARMVAALEESGDLAPGPLRDALLALPRQVLMPQAYVRRSAPEQTPPSWQLLDWAVDADREELAELLHGGGSVMVQHAGEPLLGRVPGPREGGSMTAMSSTMAMTVPLLTLLDLRPGTRFLDVVTWAGVTAAAGCFLAGDHNVVTLDLDPHVGDGARERLTRLGYRPAVVTGDGQGGWPERAPYERIFVSFGLPQVPPALVAQLAPGGHALMTVSSTSPSWPGLAVITRAPRGRVRAELRGVEFGHRAGSGFEQVFLSTALRTRATTAEGAWRLASRLDPPRRTDRGFWTALSALRPGPVRDFTADGLVVGAPGCGSWMRARPDGTRGRQVTAAGPRNIWDELHTVAALWRRAGSPAGYRIEFDADGTQRATTPCTTLTWALPTRTLPATSPGAAP
ncbi:protein-L-isoaspartate O-methyltransferase [Streptomyces sp. NPDC056773]|uniref:protein-L-isoaspartate O-methyltransferase n=1 Tax=unclassified Streptomyces TaxID=2593676 RepID=UPI003683EDE1